MLCYQSFKRTEILPPDSEIFWHVAVYGNIHRLRVTSCMIAEYATPRPPPAPRNSFLLYYELHTTDLWCSDACSIIQVFDVASDFLRAPPLVWWTAAVLGAALTSSPLKIGKKTYSNTFSSHWGIKYQRDDICTGFTNRLNLTQFMLVLKCFALFSHRYLGTLLELQDPISSELLISFWQASTM